MKHLECCDQSYFGLITALLSNPAATAFYLAEEPEGPTEIEPSVCQGAC